MILKNKGNLFKSEYVIENEKNIYAELINRSFDLNNSLDIKNSFKLEHLYKFAESANEFLVSRRLNPMPVYEIYFNNRFLADFKPDFRGKGTVNFKESNQYTISEISFYSGEFFFFRDGEYFVKFQDIRGLNKIASLEINPDFQFDIESEALVALGSSILINTSVSPFFFSLTKAFGFHIL